jgi:hypothetical protein
MKHLNLFLIGALLVLNYTVVAQTNPSPHVLADSDFSFNGFADGESTTYPVSIQGWRFAAEPVSGFVGAATGDRDLATQSSTTGTGSIKNEGQNGISFLNSGSNHIGAVALAINTEGLTEAFIAWTAQDIRDGATRENGIILQYRIGDSGDFTDIPVTTYLGSPTGLASAQNFSIALPSEAINQPLVQFRWMYYFIAGSGNRDRLQIDDIIVSQEDASGLVPVTFRVDVSQYTGTISPSGMHLAGTFADTPWMPEMRPMTDEGNGIWSYTELLEAGISLQYKFVRGSVWEDGDESVAGLACAAPGEGNRLLVVPDAATTLPLVCIDSCDPCQTNPETVTVTFRVDMSNETVAVGSGGTAISGTFNGWTFQQMTNEGNGIWSYSLEVNSGSSVQYKFRNGSTVWENPPVECSVGSPPFNNRNLIVPAEDVVLTAVCFGSCETCQNPGTSYDLTFIVDVSELATIDPAGIHIAGSFNSFSPVPMVNAGGSLYTFTANIPEGSTVLWKYLNGSTFDNVEIVPEACGEDDGFEGFNRIYVMPSAITVLNVVCFSSCDACESQPEVYPLIFQVDASNLATVNPEGLHIAGNFNDWSPVPMQSAGNGLYTYQAIVEAGTQVSWKYINGSSFDGAETVPSTCGIDDGFGGFNRVFDMPDQITVLDAVCFSSCAACIPDGLLDQEKVAAKLLLFPNPASGSISIEAPATGMANIHIFDLSGKLLKSENLFVRAGEILANLNIPAISGMYIIEMMIDGKAYRNKLLVE